MEIKREKSFGATPESVAGARRFVVKVLENVATDLAAVELLTGQIAANAVLHADSEFRVRVFVNARLVRVEIVNDEPELLLSVKEPSEHGGRGLRIVEALAQDWGTESHPQEKIVWFEISTAAADDASIDV